MDENRTPDTPEVVVGTDGTETALRAVAWAATEGRLRGLQLRIVHAAPYATSANAAGRRRAAAILARAYTVARQREPNLTAHTGRLDDQPVPALLQASEGAELLVVGMVGERPDEVIIGSVALTVSGKAHCPVTVVRGHHRTPSTSHPVLLGVADIAADAAAVTVAFADAQRRGTRLVVLHTRHGTLRDRITGANPDTAIAHTLEERLAPWRARYPSVPVDVRIVRGAPADELLRAASGARLVVVATRGRGAPARAVLGSSSRTLVRHSPCPVTVVRRDDLLPQVTAPPGHPAATADPHGSGAAAVTVPIAVRETHIGVVFLVGDRAYKMKKPVRTAFLDFSTPQLRRAACHREVELNRRLAPDVYLGISDVLPPADPSTTGAAGAEPAEHLVVMRRMPDDRRLATLVTAGEPVDGELRELARLMAAFHARADRSAAIAADGSRDALRGRWAANLAELAPFAGTVLDQALIDALGRLSMRFLDGRAPLFQDRLDQDKIVDGHGDLIAADVFCLDDGPRVLDCLEFDDHLRHLDGLDDVAFLAMDLERLGRADLAGRFLEAYAEFSGDPAPAALRHHYIAYRAAVRAKVACLRHRQGDGAAAAEASEYATLALRHLERGAVRLAIVGGLPGTGKTTLGGAMADRFGTVLLSSDRLRKELSGIDPDEHARAPFREGLYTEERTVAMYAELLHRAEVLLARGESVVLDASWTSALHRRAAEELARRTSSDLIRLQCRTTAETAGRRIMTRGRTASDATVAVSLAMSTEAEPWPEAVTIPTYGTVAESLELASSVWRGAPAGPGQR